ncbi:8640_t:CDS:2, partial [Scutellospora calospora]
WYGWRYQIPFLVSKGFRVIAPDLRGFGQTEAPRCPPNDLQQYGYKNICKDLKEIMGQLRIIKAIFIGHDWGGGLVWRMCLHYPERVRAVVSPPNDSFLNIESLVEVFPNLHYQLYLSHPKAEVELNNNPELYLKATFRTSKPDDFIKIYDGKSMTGNVIEGIERSPLMSQKELDYYVLNYKTHGFHGGLNWYKTRKINYQDEKGVRKLLNHHALIHIEEAGHWVMLERPNKLNEYIGTFLENLKKIGETSQENQTSRAISYTNSK